MLVVLSSEKDTLDLEDQSLARSHAACAYLQMLEALRFDITGEIRNKMRVPFPRFKVELLNVD